MASMAKYWLTLDSDYEMTYSPQTYGAGAETRALLSLQFRVAAPRRTQGQRARRPMTKLWLSCVPFWGER